MPSSPAQPGTDSLPLPGIDGLGGSAPSQDGFDESAAGWRVRGGVIQAGGAPKVVCMASRPWGGRDGEVAHVVAGAPVRSPAGVTGLQIENYLLMFKKADRPGTAPGPLPVQLHLDGVYLSGNGTLGPDGSLTLNVRRYALYRPLEAALLAGRSVTVLTPTASGPNLVMPGTGFREAAALEQRCLESTLARLSRSEEGRPAPDARGPVTSAPGEPAPETGTGTPAQGAQGRSMAEGWTVRWSVREREGNKSLVCVAEKAMADGRSFAIASAHMVRRNGTSQRMPWVLSLQIPMPVGMHRMVLSVDNKRLGVLDAISLGRIVTLPLIGDGDRILEALRDGRNARLAIEGSANSPTWTMNLAGTRNVIGELDGCSNRLLERVLTGDDTGTDRTPDAAPPPGQGIRPPIGGRNLFRT